MAAATAIASTDLRTATNFPIRLGSSIIKPAVAKRYAAVRYNFKPKLPFAPESTAFITPDEKLPEEGQLSLKHDGQDYAYTGRDTSDGQQYVLVCYGEGKDRYWMMDRLKSCHEFNLSTTTNEQDPAELAAKHPHIPPFDGEGDEDQLFGDDDDEFDDPVDEHNPFDFRHFLKLYEEPPKPAPTAKVVRKDLPASKPSPRASTTTASRPGPKSAKAPPSTASTPNSTTKTTKRKAPASTSKANAKRVKAGAESPPPASPPTKSTNPAIPRVKLERRASTRRQSIEKPGPINTGGDDEFELILENETPLYAKPPRSAGSLALAFSGQLGTGPISLRSVASSPASRIASPLPPRPTGTGGSEEEGEYEFEIGGSASPPSSRPGASANHRKNRRAEAEEEDEDGGGDDEEDEEDDDADADVEDLELPSPAQAPSSSSRNAHSVPAPESAPAVADDEDDLEGQLELAFMEPASEEESEEE